jgi:hypothetical protein
MANDSTWLQAHTAESSSWSTVGSALILIMNVAQSEVVFPDASDPVTAAIETWTLGKLACLPSEAILTARDIVHLAGRACERAPSAIGHAADFQAQPFQDEAERQRAERQDFFKDYLNGLHDGLGDHAILGLWVSAPRVWRSFISVDSASLGFTSKEDLLRGPFRHEGAAWKTFVAEASLDLAPAWRRWLQEVVAFELDKP